MPLSARSGKIRNFIASQLSAFWVGSLWLVLAMKLIMLPLVISVAYVGFEHRDAAIDLYRLAYPGDLAKHEALDRCARIDPNFNRLDAGDRDNCYATIVSRVAVGTGPEANIYYEQNPSHLPANDVRRQEANNAYGAARAAMAVPAVAHQTLRNGQIQ
jgi:hypothetical protein